MAEWVDVAVLDDVKDPDDVSDTDEEKEGSIDSVDDTVIDAVVELEQDRDIVAVEEPPVGVDVEETDGLCDDSLLTEEEEEIDAELETDTDGDSAIVGVPDEDELELELPLGLTDGDGDSKIEFGVEELLLVIDKEYCCTIIALALPDADINGEDEDDFDGISKKEVELDDTELDNDAEGDRDDVSVPIAVVEWD